MPRIVACGCGLRTRRAWSRPGRTMSWVYTAWPVTLAGASSSGVGRPTTRKGASGMGGGRRVEDGLDDLRVPGAPAHVPHEAPPHLRLGRAGQVGEEGGRRHDEPRRAEAALERAVTDQRGLEPGQTLPANSLDRRDPRSADLEDRRQACQHGPAVEMHGAGAALAEPAAVLGPGEPALLA